MIGFKILLALYASPTAMTLADLQKLTGKTSTETEAALNGLIDAGFIGMETTFKLTEETKLALQQKGLKTV
jgi:DNA-binding IclR family transcriptional regulator